MPLFSPNKTESVVIFKLVENKIKVKLNNLALLINFNKISINV